MPVITVYRHGGKGGVAPMNLPHIRTPRGGSGWSPGAVRRNTEFLMCVREDKLTGVGLALTLTVRDCPATSKDWHNMRRAWEARMRRAGMIRLHWVTEWQRRGVPHLHCAIWFSGIVYDVPLCIDAWLAVASSCGAALRGQHGRIIDGVVGWFQYVSKHAARGVRHYQRCSENLLRVGKGLLAVSGVRSGSGRSILRFVLISRTIVRMVMGVLRLSPFGALLARLRRS